MPIDTKVELFLLGALRILVNGQLVTNTLPVKAQALLCYLALTGETHTRQGLAGLLWGDATEQKALGSLRVALNSLRKLLPDQLVITHLTVALQQNNKLWLDVHTFAAQMQALPPADTAAGVATLRTALRLYRGDFLADFFIDDAYAFEEWILAQRAQWQQLSLRAFQQLTAGLFAQHHYREAVDVLTQRLMIEPWEEAAHRQLMLAHSRLGNFNAALAQYATCRRLLAAELGVEPMPETSALAEQIQNARRAGPPILPIDAAPLLGRTAQLAQIQQRLSDPTCNLLTIVGLGGIGKTRLALEAAHLANQEQLRLFLNGVVFVPGAGVESSAAFPFALAEALQIPLPSHTQPTSEILRFLRNKELLLVLDNFEHLLSSVDLLIQILTTCPQVKLLVASREPLNLAAEWRLDLHGLAYGEGAFESAEQQSAVQLFVQAGRQVNPAFQLTRQNYPQIVRLCQLVGGVPLALKLAATWVRVMSCAQIVAEVERSLDILSSQLRDLPPRQRSMRAIFDQTWALLTAEEQRVFRAVAVFRGGFTAAAARAVAGGTPFLMARLHDLGLVQSHVAGLETRYVLHEFARQYAAQQLAASGAAFVQHKQHCTYYLTLAEKAEHELAMPVLVQHWQHLTQERENLRAALHWSSRQADDAEATESGLRLIAALWPIWFWREAWQEGNGWLGRFFTLATRPSPGRAKVLRYLGIMANLEGDLATAQSQLQESIALWRILDNTLELARTLLCLGAVAIEVGELRQAQAALEESQRIFQDTQDAWGILLATHGLGQAVIRQGAYPAAQAFFAESLTLSKALNDVRGMLWAHLNLLLLAQLQNDRPTAHIHYQEVLALRIHDGERAMPAHVLRALAWEAYWVGNAAAWAAYHMGEHGTATMLFEEQLVVSRAQGDQSATAWLLYHLGCVARSQGDDDRAEAFYRQSLQVFQRLDAARGVVLLRQALGYLQLHRAQIKEAMSSFTDCFQQWCALGHIWNSADCLVGLAALAHWQEASEQAAHLLGAAHELYTSVDLSGAYETPANRDERARIIAAVRQCLPTSTWQTAWSAGRAMARQAPMPVQQWIAVIARY